MLNLAKLSAGKYAHASGILIEKRPAQRSGRNGFRLAGWALIEAGREIAREATLTRANEQAHYRAKLNVAQLPEKFMIRHHDSAGPDFEAEAVRSDGACDDCPSYGPGVSFTLRNGRQVRLCGLCFAFDTFVAIKFS